MTNNQAQTVMEFKFEVTEFGRFLQEKLTVSSTEIAFVMQKQEELNAPIPMLLWQYGLVSRPGLDRLFDWLDSHN